MNIQYDANTEQLNKYVAVFGDIQDVVTTAVELAVADASPSALQAARATPRPAVHPFRWSYDPQKNAKARRYYHAAIARGEIRTDGSRYIRSGRHGKSFDTGVRETNNGVEAVFGSDFDKASYVVGNEDGSIKQIPGHDRTGWTPFQQPAEQFVDDVVKGVDKEIPNVFTKRVE